MNFLLAIFALIQVRRIAGTAQSCEEDEDIESLLRSDPCQRLIVMFKGRLSLKELVEEAKKNATTSGGSDHTKILPSLLKANSMAAQDPVLKILEERQQRRSSAGGSYKQLWAFNMLVVEDADLEIYKQLKSSPNVMAIKIDKTMKMEKETMKPVGTLEKRSDDLEWGVKAVHAPEVWAQGYKGQGVVVGVIDSGIRATHVALKENFRRSFGWFDAVNGRLEPYDDHGHGSHVVGTVAGKYGLGVAPEAKIIACKALDQDNRGKWSDLLHCLQWMYCPTDGMENGGDVECSMRPKIVSNSWGGDEFSMDFLYVLDAFTVSGIIHVFSAGNHGNQCSTVSFPGNYHGTITVGATNYVDQVWFSSSRGPTSDGRIKPDIAAPGVDVVSCGIDNDKALVSFRGTSMATPHVAGIAALLASKDPSIDQETFRLKLTKAAGPHKGLESILNADFPSCGSESEFPNNYVGWGIANAEKSLQLL